MNSGAEAKAGPFWVQDTLKGGGDVGKYRI